MAKAIVPTEMPKVPDNMTGWRRSLRRGSVYHLHSMGEAGCGSIYLDRHKSESARQLGDMQFWGVCPRCFKRSQNA